LYNAAALIQGGRVVGRYHKLQLPNYGVFDERRYFRPGTLSPIFTVQGRRMAVTICEDLWITGEEPHRSVVAARPDLIVSLNASPFEIGKGQRRERVFGAVARAAGAPLLYVNQVGGQDELVFDGQSLVFDARGRLTMRGAAFAEDWLLTGGAGTRRCRPALPPLEEVYRSLVFGVRDYARKNRFPGAVIGLSGGVDSALTAVIAADALGPGRVTGVSMPSRFTSGLSREEGEAVARRLDIRFMELPVEPQFRAFLGTLGPHLDGPAGDLARQNLQSRIRGALLMSLSNRYGWLLLATGNKSEMSVGYATLYGDLAGGFAALKDVPKTLVYQLARWRNAHPAAGERGQVIPPRTISRPPTAELRDNQRDTDSLPAYPVLDGILQAYVEENRSIREIVRMGFAGPVVRRVVRMVERNEYKRRQAPPGVKIRAKAFGKDRRPPITHGFAPWSG
jgi:NAD+ synthase (glutamine-hydrolysing)